MDDLINEVAELLDAAKENGFSFGNPADATADLYESADLYHMHAYIDVYDAVRKYYL